MTGRGCGKQEKEKAIKNIERLGITNLTKKCYGELSGGQQQRVLLARALCATKHIIMLDEPIAGLDPDATGNMYDIIRSLHNDGITVIMITHDKENGLKNATHILHVGTTVTKTKAGEEEKENA